MAFNFSACANAISEDSFETNQYAVYDALITDEALSKDVFGNPSLLVIIERTKTDTALDPFTLANVQKKLPSLSKATLYDFRSKNENRVLLKDSFALKPKRVFISDEELKTILKDRLDWEAFYKKYPDSQGVMTLSNVGFDREMKQAFVYVANTRGSMNGVGLYVVLEKQDGVWRVKEKATGWMS
jgi:hypothetical protein